jgi:hypothetical protein
VKSIERGQWTLRGEDLSFSPSPESGGCRNSNPIVLVGVEQIGGGTLLPQ